MSSFFSIVNSVTDFLWEFPAIILIVVVGLFFSFRSGFFQIRKFPAIVGSFVSFMRKRDHSKAGVHPITAFFASLGGSIGIGNVVVICAAVQLGGPGAIFWAWVTGLLGMLLKYAEVYLGMRFRVKNHSGSYDGGPMYYLPKAYKVRWIAGVAAVLLCVYGAEVFVFSQLTESISTAWELNRYFVIAVLLLLTLGAALGGVRRVGEISSAIIPIFVVLYLIMSLWILIVNISAIPAVITLIFKSAFTGHAAVGAFAGASWVVAMGQGAARGAYSGDIGIGYASVIHAESSTVRPGRQAALAVFGIFLDTFVICSLSVALILITNVWDQPLKAGVLVQTALSNYFPYMDLFMPLFLFLLGYSTLIAYLVFGLKCAKYLSRTYGQAVYTVYASIVLVAFALFEPTNALTLMALIGALLLIINVISFFLLRREVRFELEPSLTPPEV
jgi:AGCS family alanine or glycine:cation symporter